MADLLIQIDRPALGRPTDKRVTTDYLNARGLAGNPFNPAIDVDLVDGINNALAQLHTTTSNVVDTAKLASLAATGGLIDFQSATAAFPRNPTTPELLAYAEITGFRLGGTQPIKWNRSSGAWNDYGQPLADAGSVAAIGTAASLTADTIGTYAGDAPQINVGGLPYVRDDSAIPNGGAIISGAAGRRYRSARSLQRVVDVRDWTSLDITGASDNSSILTAALTQASGLGDSVYVQGQSNFGIVQLPAGRIVAGDVALRSGTVLQGAGRWATQLIPFPGAAYVLDTAGTSTLTGPQTGPGADGLTRMFCGGARDLSIGTANYYDIQSGVPAGVGGIRLRYASYAVLERIYARRLAGRGLLLEEFFDGSFYDVTLISCGTPTVPSFETTGGAGTDGSNAIQFTRLHIEHSDYGFRLGDKTRHVQFIAPKFEFGGPNAVPARIENTDSVTFVAAELTWIRDDIPMIDVIGRSVATVFDAPTIISPLHAQGWYFRNATTDPGSRLQIIAPQVLNARTLARGPRIDILGGSARDVGPEYLALMGESDLTRHVAQYSDTPGTTVDNIVLTGLGNVVERNRFSTSAADDSDGRAYVRVDATATDAVVVGNRYGGKRALGTRVEAPTADVRDNLGVGVTTLLIGLPDRRTLTSKDLGVGKLQGATYQYQIPAAAGDTLLSGVLAGGSLYTVRLAGQAKSCVIWHDAGVAKVIVGDAIFTDSDATLPAKYIFIAAGADLFLRNRTGVADTLAVAGLSAQ